MVHGKLLLQFFQLNPHQNVTKMLEIGVRRPLAGGGSPATTMDSNDFYVGSGRHIKFAKLR